MQLKRVKPNIPKESFLKKNWKFITGFGLIMSIVIGTPKILEMLKSKHDIEEDKNIAKGYLRPPEVKEVDLSYDTLESPPIFTKARIDTFPPVKGIKIKDDGTGSILVLIGHTAWSMSKDVLEKGVRVFSPKTIEECGQADLNLVLKNNRIYVSTEFRDLQKSNIVGKIVYNHWEIQLNNKSKYNNTDEKLEVFDLQGYVIFSISFSDKGQSNNGAVVLSGYFMSPSSVLIVNTDEKPKIYTSENIQEAHEKMVCITKDSSGAWRTEAEKRIAKIKSVY